MEKVLRKKIVASITIALAFGAISINGTTAFAADEDSDVDTHYLDETVVTATRTPNKELKTNANITVVTGRDLERRHYTDLKQALRDVPGVTVNQYSLAGYNNSDAIYINGSADVVVLIDGVRQNYAGGQAGSILSSMKDLGGIDRIEVLHGSASTLYGSDAKGGVINIITKKATGVKTTISAGYGSYGRQLYSVANAGSADRWDWRIKYQKDKSSDFKDAHGDETPSELDANSVSVHIGNQLSKASYLAFNLRSYKDTDRYQALYEKRLGQQPKNGEYDRVDGNLIWTVQIDTDTKNQMSYGRSKYDYMAGGYGLNIWTTKFSDQFDKKWGDHLLTAGFDFTKDETNGTRLSNRNLINRSFYVQDQWNIMPNLNLTAGIRHDSNSGFGSKNSPSVSIGYDIDPMTHAYMSYSAYFITPTPSQLYGSYGNPNMKPESGQTKEIGIARDFGKGLSVTASYFKRHSKNRIGYNMGISKYDNVGDEDARGWSVQLAKRVDSHFRTRLGYTHTHVDPTAQRTTNVDGYLPKDQWNIGIDYINRDFDASLLARGMVGRPGPQTADAYANFFPTDNYWVVDLAMNYQIADETKIYLKVNNLFNQFYAEHSNARANWWGAPGQWWTAPGRNFMVGIEQSF